MSSGSENLLLYGISGSQGVGIARAVIVRPSRMRFTRRRIEPSAINEQWEKYEKAVRTAVEHLRTMAQGLAAEGKDAAVLDAYVLMVGDETLAAAVRREIEKELRGTKWAVATAVGHLAAELSEVDDPYLRQRSADVEFVGECLLRALSGEVEPGLQTSFAEPAIVVARDLSPSDTAAMFSEPVEGFVIEMGTRTSHTAIMARALEIPAVVGVDDALKSIRNGDLLIVDGLRGQVLVHPSRAQLELAQERQSRYQAFSRRLHQGRNRPCRTRDGTPVTLQANVELPAEVAVARDHGAQGIGLYRTEFMYIDRFTPPNEDEQLQVFRSVLETMGDRPVTLRTFDIGGDKFVSTVPLPDELNPMLGLRAVRLALSEPEVFLPHLRAMVRASVFGMVRIMVPMVARVEELLTVRRMLQHAIRQVRSQGFECAEQIPLGAMIEVPSAAVMADSFACVADFLSIGTNDLVQYALAIDRSNQDLAHMASPLHPSILRLIAGVVRAGQASDCPVSVCGEMASEPFGALLLVGLGLRELSMEPVAIAGIREALRRVALVDLERVAADVLDLTTASQVERVLADAFSPLLRDILTDLPDWGSVPLPPELERP